MSVCVCVMCVCVSVRVSVCECEGGRAEDGRSGAALKTKTPHANVGNKRSRRQ